jgi:hypothetical protein
VPFPNPTSPRRQPARRPILVSRRGLETVLTELPQPGEFLTYSVNSREDPWLNICKGYTPPHLRIYDPRLTTFLIDCVAAMRSWDWRGGRFYLDISNSGELIASDGDVKLGPLEWMP